MTTRKLIFACAALLSVVMATLVFVPGAAPKAAALFLGIGALGMLISENPRITDVVLWEDARDIDYARDAITILSGTAASVIGQVLGKITLGAVSSAVKAAGANTGAGSLTLDATTPALANCKVGLYTVRVTQVGTISVIDPFGVSVGVASYAAGGSVTFADEIKFAFVDDATTHWAVGDGFDITVAAGSGKYTQLTPAALNGSQNAAGILIGGASTTTYAADTAGVAVVRGPAILKTAGLAWTSGMTATQQTAALAQLAALGITARGAYGV